MRHRQGKAGVYVLFLIVDACGRHGRDRIVKWLYKHHDVSSSNTLASDQPASGGASINLKPGPRSTQRAKTPSSRPREWYRQRRRYRGHAGPTCPAHLRFRRVLRFFFGPELMPRVKEVERMGSGFVFSKEGYILTNFHVVEGAQKLFVTFSDGKQLEGRIVGVDSQTDLAVVAVKGQGYQAHGSAIPTPCSSESGHRHRKPVRLFHQRRHPTVTVGVISAVDRNFAPRKASTTRV